MDLLSSTLTDDSGWDGVLCWLPSDLDERAQSSGALERRRVIRDGQLLLRLAMAYSVLDLSLRSVAGWASTHGLVDVSDVAVLKRLRKSGDFLAGLVNFVLQRRLFAPVTSNRGMPVKIIDATTLSLPGSDGVDWRLHATYDLGRGCISGLELTDASGGEHLGRAAFTPGDLVVGDRGYAHGERIAEVLDGGGHILVRIGHSAVRLEDEAANPIDPLAWARRRREGPGRPPRVEERACWYRTSDGRRHALRLVVVRKEEWAAVRERRRVAKAASKKGKKPTQRTMDAAAFILLLTSVDAKTTDCRTIAELYRVRWQVELAFKRAKSLFTLDQLRAPDPGLAKTYIYAKLLAILLSEDIARGVQAFSPWGTPPLTRVEPVAA